METKFTEGPWVIYPETDGTEICAVDMEQGLPVRQAICVPVRGANWIDNARLIAAAPELLAALERFANYPGAVTDADFEIARAAIAKATGSQP